MTLWKRRQARADIHVGGAAYVNLYTFVSEDDGARLLRCVLSVSQADEADPSQVTMVDLYRGAATLQTWDAGNLLSSTLAVPAPLYGSPQLDIPMDVVIRAGDILRIYSARVATSAAYASVSLDLGAPPRIVTEETPVPFPGCSKRGLPGRIDLMAQMGFLGAIAGMDASERGIWVGGWMACPSILERHHAPKLKFP